MPAEAVACKQESGLSNEYSEILQVSEDENRNVVDIFSIHSGNGVGTCLKYLNLMMCQSWVKNLLGDVFNFGINYVDI